MTRKTAMWTVIYMAKDEELILSLKEKLVAGKVMTMLRTRDEFFEILVPSAEVDRAHGIIIETEL